MDGHCVIRVDSGLQIGVGHVSRCLSLAAALRQKGMATHFISRKTPGAANHLIEQAGFPLHWVSSAPESSMLSAVVDDPATDWDIDAHQTVALLHKIGPPPDWLIVDHYGLDARWERAVRGAVRRILVIDDLANRPHDCDLLLDQALRDDNPYKKLVVKQILMILGPRYALLRDEFRLKRMTRRARTGHLRHLLVFFGGSDPTNETGKTLEALRLWENSVPVDVIVGSTNPLKDQIEAQCRQFPHLHFHCEVTNMAELLDKADLAIGAAGVSAWERLAIGVPALIIQVADNQLENARQLNAKGVAVTLGTSASVSAMDISNRLDQLQRDPEAVRAMSERAAALVDGEGAYRVADCLLGMT